MSAQAWNALLGFPIYSDVNATYTPTFSGGSWSGSLPLTNLQDRRLAKVARSADASYQNTQFDIDLKTPRAVRVRAIPPGHNLSINAQARARSFTALPFFESLDFSSGWTPSGSPTRTGAALSAGGCILDLLADTSGAVTQYYLRNLAFTGNGQKVIAVEYSKGTINAASGSQFKLRDQTAATDRLVVNVSWSGTVPTVSVPTGSLLLTESLGGGVYRSTFLTTAVTAANTNELDVAPALTNTDQGNLYVGIVNAWDAATIQLVYDSGFTAVFPVIYPANTLPADHPSAGTLKLTAEDAVGYPMGIIIVPSASSTAQYERWNFNDPGNSAGYIQLPRLIIAYGYQLSLNADYGLTLGYESESEAVPSDDGAKYYNDRRRRRTATMVFSNLPEDEALSLPFDFERRVGITNQFFFVFDPTDTVHMHRRSFLAVQKDLSPMAMAMYRRYGVPINIVEEL